MLPVGIMAVDEIEFQLNDGKLQKASLPTVLSTYLVLYSYIVINGSETIRTSEPRSSINPMRIATALWLLLYRAEG